MHSSRIATEVSLPSLRRVVIENVEPEVDGGRFAIKRVVGESVSVEADINADGHQVLDAVLCFRAAGERGWSETPMRPIGNDRWQGRFQVPEFKPYPYTVQAWLDPYKTWIRDLAKKAEAGQDVSLDLLAGAELAAAAATRAQTPDAQKLLELSAQLKNHGSYRPPIGARRGQQRQIHGTNDALSGPVARYDLRKGIAGLG